MRVEREGREGREGTLDEGEVQTKQREARDGAPVGSPRAKLRYRLGAESSHRAARAHIHGDAGAGGILRRGDARRGGAVVQVDPSVDPSVDP